MTCLQEAEQCRASALASAIAYLETRWMALPDDEIDVFETCIATYALHVAGSPLDTEAFYMMDALKRTGNVYRLIYNVNDNDIPKT